MSKDINDRTFPFKNGYTPSSSEDACRYCKWGFIHGKEDKQNWACNKPSGNFPNRYNYCGYFRRHDDIS